MDFELELAASFITVVDEWHFGRAADELFITTSALTKRIQPGTPSGRHSPRAWPRGNHWPNTCGSEARSGRSTALLRQARIAAEAIRAAPSHGVLRVGFPSGARSFLPALEHAAVAQRFRQYHPERRVALVEIPFPLLNRCLPGGRVDVLLTIAAVRHGEVTATDMCEQRLLHKPCRPGRVDAPVLARRPANPP